MSHAAGVAATVPPCFGVPFASFRQSFCLLGPSFVCFVFLNDFVVCFYFNFVVLFVFSYFFCFK